MPVRRGHIGRGAASAFDPRLEDNPQIDLAAANLVSLVYQNTPLHALQPPRHNIIYRSSANNLDVLTPVYRWDRRPPYNNERNGVFEVGFSARSQNYNLCDFVPADYIYFNAEHHINHGGRPAYAPRQAHGFISTTHSRIWSPNPDNRERDMIMYKYEIYAPGGISAAETLGTNYNHRDQAEIAFIDRIDPRYIRSAHRYRIQLNRGCSRMDNKLYMNPIFNPLPRNGNYQLINPVGTNDDESTLIPSVWGQN